MNFYKVYSKIQKTNDWDLEILYATSLSDNAWEIIKPLFEYFGYHDRGQEHSIRLVVGARFFIVDNRNKWCNRPAMMSNLVK